MKLQIEQIDINFWRTSIYQHLVEDNHHYIKGHINDILIVNR
jgi:hypothetical protein